MRVKEPLTELRTIGRNILAWVENSFENIGSSIVVALTNEYLRARVIFSFVAVTGV